MYSIIELKIHKCLSYHFYYYDFARGTATEVFLKKRFGYFKIHADVFG